MKRLFMKRLITLSLCFILLIVLTGCAKSAMPDDQEVDASLPEEETYLFTDSIGREVELPKSVERIAPSGPLAQIILYTLSPDKIAGWSSKFTEGQEEYIDKSYTDLPVFGNFYGDTLNLEALMVAKPQIIIDVGEVKPNIKEDMSGIQDKTGIPTIFIEMNIDSMIEAYSTLGKILGEEMQADKISEYIEKTLKDINMKLGDIEENKSVYYCQDEGLTGIVADSIHGDVIYYAGGINVVQVEETIRGGAAEISMEQLLLWNPQVILFAPGSIYDDVLQKPEWKELAAIKGNSYYEIPGEPYNWMGRPPSVNRLIGIKWLSNLLYPEVFDYDMEKEAKEFYKLFYHCDVTDVQLKGLLEKSTNK